ncbi:MAG TPA: hypothetical protein VGF48_15200 [Thermoanaerobaculia bacterium]|jgi:predicted transcriptional regulator
MARQITITLDEDVATRIERAAERSHRPLDEVANEMLRKAPEPIPRVIEPRPFVVRTFNLGMPRIDLDCTGRALEELDRLERED